MWHCGFGLSENALDLLWCFRIYSKYSHFLPERGKRCVWTALLSAHNLRSQAAHPSPSSWRKVSQLDLEDVGALLRQQDRGLLLLQPSLILCLCLHFFLNLKIKMKCETFCNYDIFHPRQPTVVSCFLFFTFDWISRPSTSASKPTMAASSSVGK